VNIVVKSRHMDVTDAIRQYAETKAGKLPKYYDSIKSTEIILGLDGDKPVAEIVVQAKRKNTFVATHRDEDLYACIDQCLHKISEQLRRHKGKVRNHQGPPHSKVIEDQGL